MWNTKIPERWFNELEDFKCQHDDLKKEEKTQFMNGFKRTDRLDTDVTNLENMKSGRIAKIPTTFFIFSLSN